MSHAQRNWRWVLAACIVVGLNSNALADGQKLVLTGSSTIAPLALEIGKRFEKLNPGVRVDFWIAEGLDNSSSSDAARRYLTHPNIN